MHYSSISIDWNSSWILSQFKEERITPTKRYHKNPKIDIKVNKEYDDDEGYVIRYDSTYSYIYTYLDENQENIDIDSLFQRFKPYFFDHGP